MVEGLFTFYSGLAKNYIKIKLSYLLMNKTKPTKLPLLEKEIEKIKVLQSDWSIKTDETDIDRTVYRADIVLCENN